MSVGRMESGGKKKRERGERGLSLDGLSVCLAGCLSVQRQMLD